MKLIIFDIDGTIAARDSSQLDPRAASYFENLRTVPDPPHIALATNQGGPACREAGWGDKYPTLGEVEARCAAIMEATRADALYIALAYETREGVVIFPETEISDPRRNPVWRKPNPGMLLAALRQFGVSPEDALMVGDSAVDAQAAQDAGVAFLSPEQFFQMPEAGAL